jgi:hypothetical protein
MQNFISIIAAAGALTMPQMGIVTNPPVAVNSCAVRDLDNPAIGAEFGSPGPHPILQLTFTNTADAVATNVTFDVKHGGADTVVMDHGRFSTGVPIEHTFDDDEDDFGNGYARAGDSCSVVAVTFADGSRWTAPGRGMATAAMLQNR